MKVYTHRSSDGCLRGVSENGVSYTGRSKTDFDRLFPENKTEQIEIDDLGKFRRWRDQIISASRAATTAQPTRPGNPRTLVFRHLKRDGVVELLCGNRFYFAKEPKAGDKLRLWQSQSAMRLKVLNVDGDEIRRRRILHHKMTEATHRKLQRQQESQRANESKERARQRLIWENAHPVQAVFEGADSARTRRVLRNLEQIGLLGRVAAQLFRTQKSSGRAKVYRGDYAHYAYHRKGEFLKQLCELLSQQKQLAWGWGTDVEMAENGPCHVLYVDLPKGQASFHSFERWDGPDYTGDWDGTHESESNIIDFGEKIYSTALVS